MSLKINYKDKTKTFFTEYEIEEFIGYCTNMLDRQVRPELYYEFNKHEFWDDRTEMTGEEWTTITKKLLLNFKNEFN